MSARQVLITGGDGYIGRRLAARHLESTDDEVLVWVRASDQREYEAKRKKLASLVEGFEGRVTFHSGDLAGDEPFHSVNPERVGLIVHTAAATRFNVDEATARSVNVEGTEKLLRFASRCPRLERLDLLGTVYASGLRPGEISEAALDDKAGFANHYEWSKWASEQLLFERFDHLPWRLFRVATIIADDESGRVTQYNAFHNTLKLFYYALLSLLPGKPETPLYFVTGRFVIDSIFELANRAPGKAIYHVAHRVEESLTLGQLIDTAFEAFNRDPGFESRRILKPLFCDPASFDLLVDGVNSFGGSVVNQALASVAPFGRQLFIRKEIQNDNLVAGLESYRSPDARRLIENACEYLARTKWGRLAEPAR
ncbi:MAG TPA: SDR family oxidoreductase [Blastocatellia bacterium]|jgi:thioester reductase-like protein|nr:SDR family oxidoreductase [Blastocatellia bacterium]